MRRLVFFAVLVLAVVLCAFPAEAHHADITATIDCARHVSGVVSDWIDSSPAGDNGDVSVSADGVTIGSGSFGPRHRSFTYSFTSTKSTGSTIVLTATTLAAWGDGAAPGDMRSTSVVVPPPCSTTTTTEHITTTTAPASTTTTLGHVSTTTSVSTTTTVRASATSTTSTSTSLPRVVGPPNVGGAALATTGVDLTPYVVAALLLLVLGGALVLVSRRSTS